MLKSKFGNKGMTTAPFQRKHTFLYTAVILSAMLPAVNPVFAQERA